MNLSIVARLCDDLVQEVEKFAAPSASGLRAPARHFERSGERRGPVPLVVVREAAGSLAVRQSPALRPLERMNKRLSVDADHDGVLGRVQVEIHDIGASCHCFRIGQYSDTLPSIKRDLMVSQNALDLVGRDVPEGFGKKTAVPLRVARGRLLLQLLEGAIHRLLVIGLWLSASGRVQESRPSSAKRVRDLLTDAPHHLVRSQLLRLTVRSASMSIIRGRNAWRYGVLAFRPILPVGVVPRRAT